MGLQMVVTAHEVDATDSVRTHAEHTKHAYMGGPRHTYDIPFMSPIRTATDVDLSHGIPVIARLPLIVAYI